LAGFLRLKAAVGGCSSSSSTDSSSNMLQHKA
jgi:hypothetical protein